MTPALTRTMLAAVGLLLAAGAARAQDWPQWRGPNRDNHVTGFTEPKTWPKDLTKKWSVKVGVGEASPLLVGDKLYVFGREGGDEVVRCLDAESGKEVWKEKYAAAAVTGPASGYPGPRSTPAVGEGKVCTLGVNGRLSCFDAATGKEVWKKDKGKPAFYTSTSPIIVDGKCIVFAGALIAFDLANGEEKWKWDGGGAPYGSPVLMTVDGVKMVVTPTAGAGKGQAGKLVGVGFADGKLLWEVKLTNTNYTANYSTPMVYGSTVVFSETGGGGKGGGGGLIALQIEKKGDGWTAKELWKKTAAAAAGYHTPVIKGDLLFGVNGSRNNFCVDLKTGETLWTGKEKRGECGSILDIGSVLVELTSDQELIVLEPSAKEYKEVTRYHVGSDQTWAVPILVGNRIYVKDKGGNLSLLTVE
jgi:outer membrane protein assembly factor BamB